MGRASRDKGKRGELEVAKVLCAYGFECRRDGRLDGDLVHDCEGYYFEVKRRETLDMPGWTRQAEAEAGEDEVPVVVYRRSLEPWRASLPFYHLAYLLKLERLVRQHGLLSD